MNLVGGYGSSSSDDEEPKEQQQKSAIEPPKGKPKGKGKARAPPPAAAAAVQAYQASDIKPRPPTAAGEASKKKRKGGSKENKASAKKSKKKKKKSKTINALVLSPEIQAALARGETLGDSDSDDEAPDKKPKIVRRPAGSDPNDLLSLLPQPSTAASADDILLKNQKKREDAKTAKSAAAAAAAAATTAGATAMKVSTAPATTTTTAPELAGGGGGAGGQGEPEPEQEESDSDDGEDDLLAGMRARSAAAAGGSDAGAARSSPLFTLPSRVRPPPGAVAADPLSPEEVGVVGAVPYVGDGAPVAAPGYAQAEPGAQDGSVAGHQWGDAIQNGHPVASQHGGYGGAGYGSGVGAGADTQYGTYGAASGQQQPASYYPPAAAQAAASFGAAVQQGAGAYEAEFGSGGGKATRRKGRDMERALARGDLGALGSETPVMDLHQGSNDYNPLRSKPVTAAMKQDQKHIESSVYDPRTGKTVKTLEPTSMQKRKHQINQLAVQAASMERDLMERSGASRLTKAQTHAKYGW